MFDLLPILFDKYKKWPGPSLRQSPPASSEYSIKVVGNWGTLSSSVFLSGRTTIKRGDLLLTGEEQSISCTPKRWKEWLRLEDSRVSLKDTDNYRSIIKPWIKPSKMLELSKVPSRKKWHSSSSNFLIATLPILTNVNHCINRLQSQRIPIGIIRLIFSLLNRQANISAFVSGVTRNVGNNSNPCFIDTR